MRYTALSSKHYSNNRQRFASRMKEKGLAIFTSNDIYPTSADGTLPFKQHSDIFYLTGVDQEETLLILFPDATNPAHREMLFVRETNDHIAVWEGHKYTKEEARAASGIQTIMWTEDIPAVIPMLMNHCMNVYVNLNENDRFASEVPYKELRFSNEMKAKYPAHFFHRSGPIMAQLRAIKSDFEIQVMQRAIDITEKADRKSTRLNSSHSSVSRMPSSA